MTSISREHTVEGYNGCALRMLLARATSMGMEVEVESTFGSGTGGMMLAAESAFSTLFHLEGAAPAIYAHARSSES